MGMIKRFLIVSAAVLSVFGVSKQASAEVEISGPGKPPEIKSHIEV